MNEVASSPTPYLNAFLTKRPQVGIDQMQARLRSALKLNDELADYFKERALIEDLYAKNLIKLNKKIFVSDKSALGNLLPAWEKIHNELVDISTIHGTFATKMIDMIENPLRSAIMSDPVYAEVRSMDPTYQKLAKDYDDRQGKLTKHKKILEKPGKKPADAEAKFDEIKKQLDATTSEWQQYSPKYIQSFQTVDEHRWYDIKTYLLEFETLQNDQMFKRVQLAGENLSSVSHFSVEDEIISFCSQYANNTTSSMLSTKSTLTSPPPPVEPMTPLPSSTPAVNNSNVAEPVSPAHSSSFAPSLLIDTLDEHVQPQSTKSTESYASSRTTGIPASTLPSVAEDIDQGRPSITPSIKSNKKASKQRKFLSTFSIRLKPKSSHSNQFGHQLHDVSESEATALPSEKNFMEHLSTQDNTIYESAAHSTLQPPPLRKTTSFADSFFNHPSSSPSQNEQLQQNNIRSTILIDEDGFSVPPPDRSPWAAATSPTTSSSTGDDQQDLSDLTSLDNSSLYGTPRIKLDIKSDPVIREDAKTSQVALTRVVSMLKETNPVASKRPRGRRELRQGSRLSVYQTETPPPTAAVIASPLSMSTTLEEHSIPTAETTTDGNQFNIQVVPEASPFAHDDDDDGEDDETGTSTNHATETALATQTTTTTPTISARITEIIHAQLQHGETQRIMVTGDIMLQYRGTKSPSHFFLKHNGIETTFIDATYLQPLETNAQGTLYQFTPKPTDNNNKDKDNDDDGDDIYITCLQYRHQHDLIAPLIVKPMWKCDDTQARLMIKYHRTHAPLHNMMMSTQIQGGHGAQSMPTGQWLVDQQRMIWSLEDQDQDQDQDQVIRAKFTTTCQAEPQPIAIRFEMKDQLVSQLWIEQVSQGARIVKVERNTRSGKYIAEI